MPCLTWCWPYGQLWLCSALSWWHSQKQTLQSSETWFEWQSSGTRWHPLRSRWQRSDITLGKKAGRPLPLACLSPYPPQFLDLTSCSRELYSPSVCSRMITRSRLLCRVTYPGSDFTWTTLANKSNLRLKTDSHQLCARCPAPLTRAHPSTYLSCMS